MTCVPEGDWMCQECGAARYTRMFKCGACDACTRDDCGTCIHCRDKPKFGGPGRMKQVCVHKKCPYKRFAPPTGGHMGRAAVPGGGPAGGAAKKKATKKKEKERARGGVPADGAAPGVGPEGPKGKGKGKGKRGRPRKTAGGAAPGPADGAPAAPATAPTAVPALPPLPAAVLDKGTVVVVAERSWPGMNRPGGVAIVTAVRHPSDAGAGGPVAYDVKYVLGGTEKNVDGLFVAPQTEEAAPTWADAPAEHEPPSRSLREASDSDDPDDDDRRRKEKRKKKKKKRDPNAPKRQSSSYFLYANETREAVRAAQPDAPMSEISKIIGGNFRALPAKERAVWDEKAARDQERYHREMAAYVPPAASSDSDSDGSQDGRRRKKKKTKRDPNAPKRPQGSYLLYANETREAVRAANPGVPITEISKIIGGKFRALSAKERAVWDEKAARNWERYHWEVATYRGESTPLEEKGKNAQTKTLEGTPAPKRKKNLESPVLVVAVPTPEST